MKLKLISRYRKLGRHRKAWLERAAQGRAKLSNDFDRTPLERENLGALLGPLPHHPEEPADTAIYSTFCGPLSKFTFDRNNRARDCPHYFVSNNASALNIAADLGWKPIFIDLPIRRNPVEAAHQAKIAKALPHLFPDLARHRFLVYSDDKQRIPHEELPGFRETMLAGNGAMALRESPHIRDNLLWEFTDSLFQDRYRVQSHQMLRYTLRQLESGRKLEAKHLFTTSFIFRDMFHRDTARINELWYDDILACGIDCQLSFDFIAQDEPAIVALTAPPRKKYLGKPITDASGSGGP